MPRRRGVVLSGIYLLDILVLTRYPRRFSFELHGWWLTVSSLRGEAPIMVLSDNRKWGQSPLRWRVRQYGKLP